MLAAHEHRREHARQARLLLRIADDEAARSASDVARLEATRRCLEADAVAQRQVEARLSEQLLALERGCDEQRAALERAAREAAAKEGALQSQADDEGAVLAQLEAGVLQLVAAMPAPHVPTASAAAAAASSTTAPTPTPTPTPQAATMATATAMATASAKTPAMTATPTATTALTAHFEAAPAAEPTASTATVVVALAAVTSPAASVRGLVEAQEAAARRSLQALRAQLAGMRASLAAQVAARDAQQAEFGAELRRCDETRAARQRKLEKLVAYQAALRGDQTDQARGGGSPSASPVPRATPGAAGSGGQVEHRC